MSVAANIDINLRGNTSGIEKAAKTTQQALSATSEKVGASLSKIETRFAAAKKRLGQIAKSISVALAGVGVTAVVGGLKEMGPLDELGKSADRIGMTTEALAGFRHAANLAGASTESLEKGLLKMQRNLSEAAAGGGTAAQAIQDLGLDATLLKNAGPEEAFQKIAAAVDKVPNQSDKIAVMMDLFGKGGAELINLVNESGELGERIKEAAEIGMAASREQIAEVEAANDAWDTMKSSFKGLFRTFSIVLAPFVQGIAEAITSAMKWINSFRESIFETVLVIRAVWNSLPEILDLATSQVALSLVSLANDFESFFLKQIPATFSAGLSLFAPAMDVVATQLMYWGTRITNIFSNIFTEVLPTIINGFWDWLKAKFAGSDSDIGAAMAEAWRKLIDRQEGEIESVFRQDAERMANNFDAAMKRAGEKIGGAMNREKGPIERALEEETNRKAGVLTAKFDAISRELRQKTSPKAKSTETDFERTGSGHSAGNGAVERGSQEALKLVHGQRDKIHDDLQKQLKVQEKSAGWLEQIAKMKPKRQLAKAQL